jgi:mono/diheme cytochrome c family protein
MKLLAAFIIGLIALPLLVVAAGLLGFLPSKATSTPPGWESAVGMRALDASLERRAKGLKNPIAANDTAALAAGAKIYANDCSGCHGDAKGPSSWGTNDFYPRVPQFVQEGSDVTPEEAYVAVHDGIRYSGMAAWGDQIPDRQIWLVANYVARIHNRSPQQPQKTGQPR